MQGRQPERWRSVGLWRAGRLAVAGVPDEVLSRGDSAVLHRLRGRVRGGLRGQHFCGAGGVQEREDAVIAHQHIHRQPGNCRPAGHRRMRAVHAHRQHHHR